MPTPSVIGDLSATASLNSPSGSENVSTTDDYLRSIQAIVKTVYDAQQTTNGLKANAADYLPLAGGSLTGLLNVNDGADIASASTVDLTAATGNTVRITGTTAITAFTMNAGQQMELIAVGALPLTYHATTMNINGGASYTCSAGDRLFVNKANDGVIRVNVTKQDGTAVVAPSFTFATQSDYNTGTDTTKALNSSILRANNLVLGTAIATTSGTSHDFTGIPSWAKRITIMLNGVSTNGTSPAMIQIGDSGGIENTGYICNAALTNTTAIGNTAFSGAFGLETTAGAAAVAIRAGIVVLSKMGTNEWTAFGNIAYSNTAQISMTAGSKTLSATLDRIRLTTVNGTDTFDAGSINIIYE